MRWVRPRVYLLAKPQVIQETYLAWLRSIGFSEHAASHDWAVLGDSGEALVTLAGRRCYLSFGVGVNPNITKVREDGQKYLNNLLNSGHGSVLEHANFTFAIEGVSRVFTGEMNRHRAGMAISEGSMRYIRYNDIPIVEVPSLRNTEDSHISEIRNRIETAVKSIESWYNLLVKDIGIEGAIKFVDKKIGTSLVRRILPMGIATGGVWTGNVRAWRHILALRGTEQAEEEIKEVVKLILVELKSYASLLFADMFSDNEGNIITKYVKV